MVSGYVSGIKIYVPNNFNDLIEFSLKKRKILIAVNVEKILNSNDDIKKLINKNIGYPDGIGAVWALRKKGIKSVVKLPGCELWLSFINRYSKTKSFYFVGGKQSVIESTVKRVKSEFEDINICNFRNGYIKTELEELELIEDIKKHQPDIVFVAMGSPKQEKLMERMQKLHPAVYQGLGGSFDVYTGKVKRAPKLWVDANLEWAYRLFKDPSRIKRQIYLFKFLINLAFNRY